LCITNSAHSYVILQRIKKASLCLKQKIIILHCCQNTTLLLYSFLKMTFYAMGEIEETRSKELALLYGLEPKEADILHMASPMHDIGKVGIPDAILNAPRKLTKEEFEVMKTHAQLGFDMLKHSNKPILKAAMTDVFDALGSERVYKKAWELEKILELFKEQSGKHFDPQLVQLFLHNLDTFTAIRDKFKDLP